MSEAKDVQFDVLKNVSPRVGFGRGMFLYNTVPQVNVGSPHGNSVKTNNGGEDNDPHMYTSTPVNPQTSDTDTTLRHLGVLITELGRHIGDSVTARLSERDVPQNNNVTVELPQLNMLLKADYKEPPIFRGDPSDKYSAQEWIDLMVIFFKKKNVCISDQAEEILSRLMGRAKDVVKIGLRSGPSLSVEQQPDEIYSILKQHFSDLSYSCLPLADFYSTLPRAHESPIDYWVRLNKAADVTEECLQHQGRSIGDLSKEVALMFVRHCNEPSLSIVFKSKLSDSWTAREVQERIDEYHRELKSSRIAPMNNNLIKQAAAVLTEEITERTESDLRSILQQNVNKPSQNDELKAIQNSMDKMAGMLSEVLSSLTSTIKPTVPKGQTSSFQRRKIQEPRQCKICNDSSHSTTAHCMLHRLCFQCYQPGHTKTAVLQNVLCCTPITIISTRTSGKLDGLHSGRGSVGLGNSLSDDLQSVYESACESLPSHATVIMQNSQRLKGSDSLFYTPVVINESETVSGMLDTGSMACSINEAVEQRLIAAGSIDSMDNQVLDVVLIGCGGQRAHPKRICELKLEVYGCEVMVPT